MKGNSSLLALIMALAPNIAPRSRTIFDALHCTLINLVSISNRNQFLSAKTMYSPFCDFDKRCPTPLLLSQLLRSAKACRTTGLTVTPNPARPPSDLPTTGFAAFVGNGTASNVPSSRKTSPDANNAARHAGQRIPTSAVIDSPNCFPSSAQSHGPMNIHPLYPTRHNQMEVLQ